MTDPPTDDTEFPAAAHRARTRSRIVLLTFWSYVLLWTALLIVPDPGKFFLLPRGIPQQLEATDLPWDKIVHGGGYALVMFGALWALASGPRAIGFGWLFGAGVFHSAMTELIQLIVPNRHGDWADLAVDVTGLCFGAAAWWALRRPRPSGRFEG